MKIVIISGNAFREDYGGVLEHVKNLIPHLSTFNDLEINFLTFGNEDSFFRKNNVNYFFIKRLKYGMFCYPFELLYDFIRLEKFVNDIDPDIIHLQSTIPLFSLFGIFRANKYPVLITVHGYLSKEFALFTGIKRYFYQFFCAPIERSALSKIPYIIVLSPQLENLINKFTSSRIYTIPNGVDLKSLEKIDSYEKTEYCSVFFLGYLTRGKGVADLIKAIQSVKIKKDKVKLFIGGIGPNMNELKELVRSLQMENDVIFLGYLDEKKKFAYMKSMDVFALPSYWESFPMVILEAMACGKPIVATNVGGNPSAVEDGVNGFLVQPGNLNDLSDKLIRLLNDEVLIKKMGEESLRRSIDFDWNVVAGQTREAYKQIIIESNKRQSGI